VPAVVEREPNDALDRAQVLTAPSRLKGDLHPVQPASQPDEDWYLVQPGAAPSDLSIAVGDFAGGRIVLEVYDHDHNRLLAATATGPLQPVVVPSLRLKDALLLRVASVKGATGNYALTLGISPTDPDAEIEPNDRAVDATPLPLGHALHGSLAGPQDRDWYRIELRSNAGTETATTDASAPDSGAAEAGVPDGGVAAPSRMLRLTLSGLPETKLRLEIFDQAQRPLSQADSHSAGEGIRLRDVLLPADCDAILIAVASASGKTPPAPYQIQAQVEPAPPGLELEPNDTFAQATPIEDWRVGYLAPAGDIDVYRLRISAPSLLRAEVSGIDGVDTELTLVDAPAGPGQRERVLSRVNEGGPKEAEIIPGAVLPIGDHFLRVQAAAHQVGKKWVRDQENADATYRLAVQLTPDDGTFEHEPNDQPGQATDIRIGQSLHGYAYPRRDVDFYRLDLSAQPVAQGIVIHLGGVAKVPLALSLHAASPDGAHPGSLINTIDHQQTGAAEEIRVKLEPGVYLISVRPHPRDHTLLTPVGDPDDAYALSVQGG
jgi:hypothetical protein